MEQNRSYASKLILSKLEKLENIHPDLRGCIADFITTIASNFKDYISLQEIMDKVSAFPMQIKSKENDKVLTENPTWAGYWGVGGEGIVIRDDQKDMDLISTTCHEFLHMCSENLKAIKYNETLLFSCSGLMMHSPTDMYGGKCGSEMGRGINEGMTEVLTEKVIALSGKYGEYKTPKSSSYKPLAEIAQFLHSVVGDKVEEAYFKGNPFILKEKFDKVLGEGAWKRLTTPTDIIYNNRNDENFDRKPHQNEAKKVIFDYYYEKEIKPWIEKNILSRHSEAMPIQEYLNEANKLMKPLEADSTFANQAKNILNQSFIYQKFNNGSLDRKELANTVNKHIAALNIVQCGLARNAFGENLNNIEFQTIPELSSENQTAMIICEKEGLNLYFPDIPQKSIQDWECILFENIGDKKNSELAPKEKKIKSEIEKIYKSNKVQKTKQQGYWNEIPDEANDNIEILVSSNYQNYAFVNDKANKEVKVFKLEDDKLKSVELSERERVGENIHSKQKFLSKQTFSKMCDKVRNIPMFQRKSGDIPTDPGGRR